MLAPAVKEGQGEDIFCLVEGFQITKEKETTSTAIIEKFVEIELKINGKGSIEVSFSKIFGERRTFLGLEELEEEPTSIIKKSE